MTPFAYLRRIRPAAPLAGGAALLVCLGLTQAFPPAPRPPDGPTHSRIQYPVTPPDAASSVPAAPTDLPAPPPATPDLSRALNLGEHGDYAAGVALALALPEDRRAVALGSLFSHWSAEDPASAASAALALSDTLARDIAWHAVVSVWALTEARGLASFIRDRPADAARDHALAEAIGHWLARDADSARAWAAALPVTPDNDIAFAAVAQHPDLIRARPAGALAWAESIHDPALRSRTLGRVVREWREFAPAAAEAYARRATDIFPAEREDILVGERFTAHP